jgi:hypothetical protein
MGMGMGMSKWMAFWRCSRDFSRLLHDTRKAAHLAELDWNCTAGAQSIENKNSSGKPNYSFFYYDMIYVQRL